MDRILNTCLAIGLGITGTIALQSSTAEGYPSTAVSTGHNPIVSTGGTIVGDGSLTLFEAGADSDIVITDIVLSVADTNSDCSMVYIATFLLSDDTNVAVASVGVGRNYYYGSGYTSIAPIQFASGVRIPAGDTLRVETNRTLRSNCGTDRLNITASGYHAQP